jgi:hypothetical protein
VGALLAFTISPAQANVMLTFNVSNVRLQTCAGAVQPTCTTVAAAGFQQSVVIGEAALATAGSSAGGVLQSQAFYGFPLALIGSPYTSALLANVTGPLTGQQSFAQLDNAFDPAALAGTASALIYTDLLSDTTDGSGVRTQQEYQLGYNLLGQFGALLSYTDLVNQSIDAFFSQFVGTMLGSFNELGSHASLDPGTLAFTDYAFSEYMGDVELSGVQVLGPVAVPEPGSLALVLAAALALFLVRRRRPLPARAPMAR